MKVICDRAALLNAINVVSGAVASRSPRPQLGCVKLVATKSGGGSDLELSATDAEVALKLTLSQVDVQKAGEALIPADKLKQIISVEDAEQTLTLQTDGDALEIRGSDARFKIQGYPAAEFPPIPDFPSDASKAKAVMAHPAASLAELISRTIFATARETSRYAINGVLFKRDGKRLEMVATDGRRLALARASLSGGEKDAKAVQCIVPSKALNMLLRLLGENDEPAQIAITDSQAIFSLGTAASPGRALLVTNLVDGAFPPYEDVIPKDQDKRVVFDRERITSGVRRASIFTSEETRGVKMIFSKKEKMLKLSSRTPEAGDSDVDVQMSNYEGDDIEIGFNPTFISDALKVINDQEVIMELTAPNKPGLIKSGNDFVYVVMPVNLQ